MLMPDALSSGVRLHDRARAAGARAARQSPAAAAAVPSCWPARWPAHWIRPADAPPKGVRRLSLPQDVRSRGGAAAVRDPRHRRQPIRAVRERPRASLTGPARGDLDHWRFETAGHRPGAPRRTERHCRGRLELRRRSADGAGDARDRTPRAGRHGAPKPPSTPTRLEGRPERRGVARCRSIAPSIFHEYFVGGPGEQVDGGAVSLGLGTPEFDDTSWSDVERAHDWRPARHPRHAIALVAGAALHSADGGSAGALRSESRAQTARSPRRRSCRAQVAVAGAAAHARSRCCSIAAT